MVYQFALFWGLCVCVLFFPAFIQGTIIAAL